MRVAPKVSLSKAERLKLESIVKAGLSPVRLVERCRVVLLADDGLEDKEIGALLGISRQKAGRWRGRFLKLNLAGLEKDKPGRGRKPSIGPKMIAKVVRMTTQPPTERQTHWSTRTLAAELQIGATSVRSIWRQHGLKPHLSATFKVSNDPLFEERLNDVIGLYVNVPEHALVLCCDEKSQVQALDRTQPGLPLKRGRARRSRTTTCVTARPLCSRRSTCLMEPSSAPASLAIAIRNG